MPKNELYVQVNGYKVNTPKTPVSWEGYELDVHAPAQEIGRRTYVFASRPDGDRNAAHAIATPAFAAIHKATFRK